jgi:hypothetical protein
MTDSRLTEQELSDLEMLIDRRGAEDVLIAISEICGEKAEHIKVNWQDLTLALRWATLEGAVGCIVPKATGL